MSAEAAREFVDTNILIYAFDASAGTKQASAQQLLKRLWEAGTGCLSVQVLQEFFVIATRKVAHPLSVEEASGRIREFATWKVFTPTANDILAGIGLQKRAKLSFWDAMVIHAAREMGCDVLWTEDMKNGQLLEGVRVRNPFAVRSPAR